MRSFRSLEVWKKAHSLTLEVYQATREFPGRELHGLTSQLRRSAASIPANVAEGCGRCGTADFRRFLHVAMGSASELEYHLLLAGDLGLLTPAVNARLAQRTVEIKRMLTGLIHRLTTDS